MISKRYVLTAAHCVGKELTSVLLGTTDRTLPMERVEVMATKVHENFSQNTEWKYVLSFDIALLKLSKNVDFSRLIQPVCLPFQVNNYEYPGKNTTFIVAGWGEREFRTSENILSKTDLRFYDHEECKTIYSGHKKYFNENILCAGGELGKDSCYGDSGGPLVRKLNDTWVLDGIVSDGIGGTCGTLNPGAYTNVIRFEKWIKSSIAELEEKSVVKKFHICVISISIIFILLVVIIFLVFKKFLK